MKAYRITSAILITIPLIWVALRVISNSAQFGFADFEKHYEMEYDFTVRSQGDYWLKTYLPQNSNRQTIQFDERLTPQVVSKVDGNEVAIWQGDNSGLKKIQFGFKYTALPVIYNISDKIFYTPLFDLAFDNSLVSTEYIQSDHSEIQQLAQELKGSSIYLTDIIEALYQYVYQLPASGTNELTDALTTLRNQEASCNGKSRLLVALTRALHIPSRMVGGIIMERSQKKTSHAWVEILVEDVWVPFDALNGHFASLPANYLQLYTGDHFLITRSSGITFDYQYEIAEKRANAFANFAPINLWILIAEHNIPASMLRVLLLLPLGALLIGILKNVIGFKTIGVFLPVLISIALIQTGIVNGLVLFTITIIIVSLLNVPLTRWGIQHTAKLTLMMTAVVGEILATVLILSKTNVVAASTPLFFPFIILTLVAEKLARTIDEDGFKTAIDMYAQTMIVTLIIGFVLNSKLLQDFLITFPEIIITIAGLNLLLGKWIGLRVLEYKRFIKIQNA